MTSQAAELKESFLKLTKDEQLELMNFFLQTTGVKKGGTIYDAMKDLGENNVTQYSSLEDLVADVETW